MRAPRRHVLACALPLLLLSCGRDEAEPGSRRGTVVIAYPHEPNGMNPVEDEGSKFLVFMPLVVEDETGELKGRLARSWSRSPDWREWTFHLRSDARWHDGVPVTAHDVKFTLDLLAHPDVDEFGPGYIESATVHDDSTITVRFGNLYARRAVTWEVYFPQHLLQKLDPAHIAEWAFWLQPVGNGPYRFVRYVPGTMMEFEANPDYVEGKPRIDRVALTFIRDAGLSELLSGRADILAGSNPTHVPKLANRPGFVAYHEIDDAYAIFWRCDHPLFRDARVRRALTMAIDRRELLRVLHLPPGLPVLSGPATDRQLRSGQLPEPLPYDPTTAAALLDSAGWRDADGDRLLERDGQPFRFTALVSSAPAGVQIATYVQAQLQRIGVRMEIQPLEQGVIWGKLNSGDFAAVFSRTVSSPNSLRRWFGAGSSIRYRDARVAELLDRLPKTLDPAEEDRILREVAEIFRNDVPATFLAPYVHTSFAHRRIRGLATPWRADPLRYMGELWLDDAR